MSAVRVVTEGRLDLAIATRLLEDRGAFAIPTGARNGRGPLLRRLRDYNAAAQRERWLVLFDLDKDECAPALLSEHLPSPASGMHVRVAVREVESWLLADSGLARYIRIPARTLPADVEAVQFSKTPIGRAGTYTLPYKSRSLCHVAGSRRRRRRRGLQRLPNRLRPPQLESRASGGAQRLAAPMLDRFGPMDPLDCENA